MKNKFSRIYKIVNSQSLSAGFTLIELLVAASITTIVVSLAGFGLVTMMENNTKAESETSRRTELNRSLDFIADEVRMAQAVATNASANLSTVALNFNSSNKTPVLTLQIPGVSQRVIYYIESPSATSVWLGPKVISRWGPSLDINGNYTNATTPSTWTYETLVDLIVDSAPSSNACPTGEPNVTTDDWFSNPAGNLPGFYACVHPNGRVAEIHLLGKLTDAYDTSIDPYDVSTNVFARSSVIP